MIEMTAHTTASLAEAINTTPRELRKFLRASGAGVGKGSRYTLDLNSRDINSMRKRYAEWDAARKAARAQVEDDAPEAPEVDDATE